MLLEAAGSEPLRQSGVHPSRESTRRLILTQARPVGSSEKSPAHGLQLAQLLVRPRREVSTNTLAARLLTLPGSEIAREVRIYYRICAHYGS